MSLREAIGCSGRVGMLGGLLALLTGAALAPAFFDPLIPAAAAVVLVPLLAAVLVGCVAAVLPGLAAASAAAGAAGAALGAATGLMAAAFFVDGGGVLVASALGGGLAGALVGRACTVPRTWRAAVALATIGLVVVAAARAGSSTVAAAGNRLVVVGVDGGTWRVMDPLLERGELPTVARMMREGVHGVLTSMEPTASPVVWTTIATGRLPSEHGIHNFYATQNDDLRAARFWEVAAAQGQSVGIFEWLVTWPPDPLPGFIVPGWLARDAQTQPPSLSWIKTLELRGKQHERPTAGELAHGGTRALYEGMRFESAVGMARDAAEAWRIGEPRAAYRAGRFLQQALVGDVFLGHYRRERPGVAAVVFYGTDALSHGYWRYHEPDAEVPAEDVARYGDSINEYYRRVDRFLGRLLDTVGPETSVMVISDHGFHGAHERDIALASSKVLKVLGEGERFTSYSLNRQVYLTHRRPGTSEAREDLARVAKVASSISIDDQPVISVQSDGTTSLMLELKEGMDKLDPGTRLDFGDNSLRLADLITPTSWSGSHEPAGIILARGPRFRSGVKLDTASIRDVAPTILALLGYPVAEDMDGRVLTEFFTEPPSVSTVASYDGLMPARHATGHVDRDVEEQLRSLGYVR